jgi:hypothetical protein
MTKNKKFRYLFIAVLIITIGIYYVFKHSEFIEIDSCLDAGGKWLKNEKRCLQP